MASLAAGDAVEFNWSLTPTAPSIPALQHFRLWVSSANGGSQNEPFAVQLVRPPLPALRLITSPFAAVVGEPFAVIYEIENIGDQPLTGARAAAPPRRPLPGWPVP